MGTWTLENEDTCCLWKKHLLVSCAGCVCFGWPSWSWAVLCSGPFGILSTSVFGLSL